MPVVWIIRSRAVKNQLHSVSETDKCFANGAGKHVKVDVVD